MLANRSFFTIEKKDKWNDKNINVQYALIQVQKDLIYIFKL